MDPVSQVIDYLDVKFNLSNHTHEPYIKPNNPILYFNVNSNHPQHIIKQVPKTVERRLSILSKSKEIFDRIKPPYQKALDDQGYKYILKYQEILKTKKRNRSRKVLYFNPPFCKSVKTNVVKMFLGLIDKHFPKGNLLHKCFNRNTVKATYCTLTNMKNKISKHNSRVLNEESNVNREKKCNCRNKNTCPIPGECVQKNVIYQADVHTSNKIMTYYGSTVDFKSRYSKHKSSFEKRPANHTTLSSYVWKIKDKNLPFKIH